MKQQDFNKQSRRIENFAELNEVPIDHFLYQQLAQAARSFREGEFEKAQFQLDDALAAAQDFGTSPQDYLPQTSISETITLTESQLRMLIRKVIYEHATDEHHGREDEHEEETDEEPVGDESIKKVYSIAKEVYNFV